MDRGRPALRAAVSLSAVLTARGRSHAAPGPPRPSKPMTAETRTASRQRRRRRGATSASCGIAARSSSSPSSALWSRSWSATCSTAMDERGLGVRPRLPDAPRPASRSPSRSIPYSADRHLRRRRFLVGLLNTLLVSVVGHRARHDPRARRRRRAAVAQLAREPNSPARLRRAVPQHAAARPALRHLLRRLPAAAAGRRDRIRCSATSCSSTSAASSCPGPQAGDAFGAWLAVVAAGVVAAIGACWHRRRREERRPIRRCTCAPSASSRWSACRVLGWFVVGGAPLTFELPVARAVQLRGRPGALAGVHGAARRPGALHRGVHRRDRARRHPGRAPRASSRRPARSACREGQMLRLVVLPQALRIIVPPLTSQYLNLIKNSSLADRHRLPGPVQRQHDDGEPDRPAGGGHRARHGRPTSPSAWSRRCS